MAEENGTGFWFTVRKWVGSCASNTELEQLKAAVELAQDRVGKALVAGEIMQGKPGAFEKLSKANEGLGKVGEALGMVQDVCLDLDAVGKIFDAVKVLKDDNVIYDDPQLAADNFDKLFNGLGRLCRFLPPPADAWGEFFERFNLFGNFQRNIVGPYVKRAWDASYSR